MLKSAILSLVLIFVMMLSSCSFPQVVEKEVEFCKQSYFINYALDQMIEQMPDIDMVSKKISLVKFDTNIEDDVIKEKILNHFTEKFNKDIVELVPLKDSNYILIVAVNHSDQKVMVTEASIGETKEKSKGEFLKVNFTFDDPLLFSKNIYKYHTKHDGTVTLVMIMVIDMRTEETIYTDNATFINVYKSSGKRTLKTIN
jgi:hypothetical protein